MENAYRIGELARRAGVTPELVRAWESRYGVLRPARSRGGFRLYSDEDIARVRRMRELVSEGVSAAQAARIVGADAAATTAAAPGALAAELERALLAFDEPRVQLALDRLLAAVTLETALGAAVLPVLRAIGDRWAAGEVSVAQEHFATTILRARLLSLARGWDQGAGRRAVLAAVPGELHDVGLIAFGLALHRRGWRVIYLGQDTPIDALEDAVSETAPALVALSATDARRFTANQRELTRLARRVAIGIGGAGASAALAKRLRARYLGEDAVAAAAEVS